MVFRRLNMFSPNIELIGRGGVILNG